MIYTHEWFMSKALQQAQQAQSENEVPIGAVVVSQHRIIAQGYNQVELLNDPMAHAEIIALTAACHHFSSKILRHCTLYVTVEPCAMCAAVCKLAQIGLLVYGVSEPKTGYTNYQPSLLHQSTQVIQGVLSENCKTLMQQFFAGKRERHILSK